MGMKNITQAVPGMLRALYSLHSLLSKNFISTQYKAKALEEKQVIVLEIYLSNTVRAKIAACRSGLSFIRLLVVAWLSCIIESHLTYKIMLLEGNKKD